MKKVLSALLVLVMCLSLCACNSGKEAPMSEPEKHEVTTVSVETELEIIETEAIVETEPQYTTVELTLDNWQEYFEFVEYVEWNKNAFGEIESFSGAGLVFQLKEAYQSSLASMSNGAVEWQYYTAIVGCNFNTATAECTLTDTYAVGDHLFSNTSSLYASDNHIGWPKYFESMSMGSAGLATIKEVYGVAGNYENALYGYPVDIEIIRIQGTLTFSN